MPGTLPVNAQKVQAALAARGVDAKVVEMPESTHTAADAARAIGCGVAQIAKSLVFRTRQRGAAVLVIASGANRVDEQRLAALVGEPIEKASPDFVREVTGFAVGGVPPVGHSTPLRVFIDQDLRRHQAIWAAAGTPRTVVQLTPAELEAVTGGVVVDVK
jgi:prolyl-tRNA editing enzyme YbaK/EbsC (Cys-tRNA(Pro) deacylase)